VKKQRTYRRFNLVAFLAILGCIGMLLFECFFIFELYDRGPLQPETPAPARPEPEVKAPAVSAAPAVEKSVVPETNAPPATNAAPARQEPALREPAEPAAVPVG
jgi:hypothetical protein